jgi:sugar-specific transcriptional regulator TrmB
MDLKMSLMGIGMEEKEAKTYLALLDLGTAKVQDIALKAGIKRPTAYVVLESLFAKNYITKTFKQNRVLYSPEKPDILLRALKQKEDLLEQAIPLLQARMKTSPVRPRVKIYEGKGGVEQVYDEIYQSKSVCLFGSLKNLSEEFVGRVDTLKKIIKSEKIQVRDLLTEDPKDIDFGLASIGKNYEARVIGREFDLYSDGALYDDKVAILSIKNDLFAVVIESKEVVDTFRSLFEIVWKMSTPLQEFSNYMVQPKPSKSV